MIQIFDLEIFFLLTSVLFSIKFSPFLWDSTVNSCLLMSFSKYLEYYSVILSLLKIDLFAIFMCKTL